MIYTYTNIWYHVLWRCSQQNILADSDVRKSMHIFIIDKAHRCGVQQITLCILPDHVHMLVCLPGDAHIAELTGRVKGASSCWARRKNIFDQGFSWPRGYMAFSVSPGRAGAVKKQVMMQYEYHKQKPFKDEYDEWLRYFRG